MGKGTEQFAEVQGLSNFEPLQDKIIVGGIRKLGLRMLTAQAKGFMKTSIHKRLLSRSQVVRIVNTFTYKRLITTSLNQTTWP